MKKIYALLATLLLTIGVTAQSYNTNRGFVHPGGLHTQEDFDRIKDLLAKGDPTITAAVKVLTQAAYAQSTAGTSPVQTIVRGGGKGENYINAARGATIAYQNALVWKITGNKANASHAINVLMQWANTTKGIGGDSNYALAAGLYGYQFAQAAELLRDYEGWAPERFEQFRQWMLQVWYPSAMGFLRGRNGTWENVGRWWQAPTLYTHLLFFEIIGILYICQMKSSPFTSLTFNDKRISARANLTLSKMIATGNSVINRIFGNFADKIATYRMFNNPKVTMESIVSAYADACKARMAESHCTHVLCLQDTCEINYNGHNLRMHKKGKTPGCVSNGETGCFLHPTLAVDPETFTPYGFTHIHLWNREEGNPGCRERKYKKLPAELKESYRWSESIDKTADLIGEDVLITMLSDRESDVYEVLKRGKNNVKLIVRSNQDRRIKGSECRLHEFMLSVSPSGQYEFHLPASHGRKARTAKMEVRFAEVCLERPAGSPKSADANIVYNCIKVSEAQGTVPEREDPIEWVLLTNHEVSNVEQALQCVSWYRCRWFIEELFRLLKKKGFMIEDIQLEDTTSVEKNILFSAYAALYCISLKHAFDLADKYQAVPASIMFSKNDIEAAKLLSTMVNGRTLKQKNPFKEGSLPWIAWIVARLGAWSGYSSQSRPGYTTFKTGLDNFFCKCEMLRIVKDVYKG